MGYLCSRCGGIGGLFKTSHIHSDMESCIAELHAKNEELQNKLRKVQHTPKPSDYDELRSNLDHANRLNETLKNVVASQERMLSGKACCEGYGTHGDAHSSNCGFIEKSLR